MQQHADQLASQEFDGNIKLETVHERVSACQRGLPEEALLPLANLLTPEQMLDTGMMPFGTMHVWTATGIRHSMIEGFAQYVLPYLCDAQIEPLRQRIRRDWDPTKAPAGAYDVLPVEYYLAACLGMHEEVLEVTSRWSDDHFQKQPY